MYMFFSLSKHGLVWSSRRVRHRHDEQQRQWDVFRGRQRGGRRHAIDDVQRSTLTRLVRAMHRGRKEWTGVFLRCSKVMFLDGYKDGYIYIYIHIYIYTECVYIYILNMYIYI